MKKWEELTPEQQESAVNTRLNTLLQMTCEGVLEFNRKDLQDQVKAAAAKAESMQTPWFMHEYLMETMGDVYRNLALSEAKQFMYAEPHESVMLEPKLENRSH